MPAPAAHRLGTFAYSEPADHGRQDVTVAWVVAVARSIEVRWHQADGIKAMLESERLTELYACDFRDGIPSIGGLKAPDSSDSSLIGCSANLG